MAFFVLVGCREGAWGRGKRGLQGSTTVMMRNGTRTDGRTGKIRELEGTGRNGSVSSSDRLQRPYHFSVNDRVKVTEIREWFIGPLLVGILCGTTHVFFLVIIRREMGNVGVDRGAIGMKREWGGASIGCRTGALAAPRPPVPLPCGPRPFAPGLARESSWTTSQRAIVGWVSIRVRDSQAKISAYEILVLRAFLLAIGILYAGSLLVGAARHGRCRRIRAVGERGGPLGLHRGFLWRHGVVAVDLCSVFYIESLMGRNGKYHGKIAIAARRGSRSKRRNRRKRLAERAK